MKDNPDDYLGKVCRNYAIYIKETEGNSAALEIFEEALKALPDSRILHIEHLSHLACIRCPANRKSHMSITAR